MDFLMVDRTKPERSTGRDAANPHDTIRRETGASESGTVRAPDASGSPATGTAPHPTVSIVIPAYNEAPRIRSTLDRIFAFLESSPIQAEMLIVDDGSTDETVAVAELYEKRGLRVVSNARNSGKGFSVRQGVLNARGDWVLVTDADLSAPIEEMDRLLEAAGAGADIVIGSRALDRSKIAVRQSRFREAGGIVYNLAVRLVLGLGFHDTQCGFKLFRRERVLDVFEKQTIDGFGFDPEILFLAARSGLAIREIPIAWSHNEGTKVDLFSDGVRMFLDLVRIRWKWMRGGYR
jgi:glycosyltransferase involved in cell wall biosynthesis